MGDATLGYKAQLLGCISFGERLGYIRNQKALLLSRPAMDNFVLIMQKLPFILEITDANDSKL
jgi:hypothetical protein